jgi:hypothetical protein
MKIIKRTLGWVWMAAGPVMIFLLVRSAIQNVTAGGHADINKPIPWIIIIGIFTPIAVGLVVFGWYAWKGEYDEEIKS